MRSEEFYILSLILLIVFSERFSGLSVVTHFSDYRRKKKRVNSGNMDVKITSDYYVCKQTVKLNQTSFINEIKNLTMYSLTSSNCCWLE